MKIRLFGMLGIIGALALNVAGIRSLIAGTAIDPSKLDRIDECLYALWGIGLICTFWLIYNQGAAGAKLLRIVPLIVVVGGAAMTLGSLLDIAGLARPASNPLFFVAWPLILLGTVITAILILVARRWIGWRLFAPLLAVLLMVLGVTLGAVLGSPAALLFGLGWLLLSYATFETAIKQPQHKAVTTSFHT